MRDMASVAASYRRERLPTSLVQRLDMMQHLALQATGQADGPEQKAYAARRGPGAAAQIVVLTWFSLGVLTSGAMGVGAVLGARALAAGDAPGTWMAWAEARLPWAQPAPVAVAEPAPRWEMFPVAIDRSAKARAPLALQVTGAGDDPVEVVLEGLPPGVRPSRGEPRGSAWVLQRSDLGGLYLSLDEAAPDAFDIRIAISAPDGIATIGGIAQVRVVDPLERTQTVAAEPARPAQPAEPAQALPDAASPAPATTVVARAPAAHSGDANADATPARSGSAAADTAHAAAQQPAATARSWPEGASALGAVPREPEADGKGWWQTPPPSWSPFQDGRQGR